MNTINITNGDFRSMDIWRIFRIISEFVEGIERMSKIGHNSVTIFGSARVKEGTPYYEMARETARLFTEQKYKIITGGGPGLMEAANRGAQDCCKGASVGLNIDLPFEQHANPYIDELITFRYFFVRKVMFSKYATAIITLPGGFGTLDEFFENLTLIQTKKVPPIPVVLMGKDFWGGLLEWTKSHLLDKYAMISPEDMDLFYLTDDPEDALNYILRALNKINNA